MLRHTRRFAGTLLLILLTGAVSLTPVSRLHGAAPLGQEIDFDLQRQALLASLEALQLSLARDYSAAIARYSEARDLYRRAGDVHGEATTIDAIAAVYERQGDYQQALALREEGLAVARAGSARVAESDLLKGLSQVYQRLGNFPRAFDLARQAVDIAAREQERARTAGDTLNTSRAESSLLFALAALGQTADGVGDYATALDAHNRRLTIIRDRIGRARAGEEGISLLAMRSSEHAALNDLGHVHSQLGRTDRALALYQEAFNIAVELYDIDSAVVYQNNIAVIYTGQGRLDEALALYEVALDVMSELGDDFAARAILNNIGDIKRAKGDFAGALDVFNRSLAIARRLGNQAGEAVTLNNLGSVHRDRGDATAAREAFSRSLALAQETGYRAVELTALGNLGALEEEAGNTDAALGRYLAAIGVAEDVRTLARIDELRTTFAAEVTSTYNRAARLLLRAGRNEEAFAFAERGRARSFLDQVSGARVDLGARGDPRLVEEERTLRAQISGLDLSIRREYALPASQRNWDLVSAQKQELDTKQAIYRDVLTRLQLSDPESASLVSVNTLTLSGVQARLAPDTTLLSYLVLARQTFAFIVTRDSLEVVTLAVQESVLRETNERFRRFHGLRTTEPPESMVELHRLLIAPLADRLQTRDVLLVPNGVLHYIPFAALSDGRQYFGERHTLTLLPSASALPFIQAKRKEQAGPFLGVAQSRAASLPPLRHADDEARTLAEQFGQQPVLGTEATETLLRSRASQAGIIHIAAHGEMNATDALFSRVFLEPDGENDGSLTVLEVYGLDLARANLVVLSACQTNLGALSQGDDVIGLTRAFITAGTPSVIASLWNVNDRATALLMSAYYRYLQEGMMKAQALQAAQADTRKEFPHPFYWAAFVLTGDGGPMPRLP